MIVSMTTIWFTLFYTFLRKYVFFLSFYAMTLQIVAFTLLTFSAGRLVVESEMLLIKNIEKKDEFSRRASIFKEDEHGLKELPVEE